MTEKSDGDLPPLPPGEPSVPHSGRPIHAPKGAVGAIRGPAGHDTDVKPVLDQSNEEAAEASWIKEMIWRYENRPRGRTSQAHLGPSEMGSACDRKLVYRLQGVKPYASGSGANWPAIVGTGVHSWFERMMQWADQERGRFLVEKGVTIVDGEVTGTLDVYDRLQHRVRDWKFPSLRAVHKYRREGVGRQYETQGHLYALGLAMQGETPKDIAIDMIARDAVSVEQGIFVSIFPYQPTVAHAAIGRYKDLKILADSSVNPLSVESSPSALCNYCPFHAPGVAGACPGT